MYALFLETRAAAQCDQYAQRKGIDAEELKIRAYSYSGLGARVKYDDNWWVSRCLDNDSHKELDIMYLFTWNKTPEGTALWSSVNRERG